MGANENIRRQSPATQWGQSPSQGRDFLWRPKQEGSYRRSGDAGRPSADSIARGARPEAPGDFKKSKKPIIRHIKEGRRGDKLAKGNGRSRTSQEKGNGRGVVNKRKKYRLHQREGGEGLTNKEEQ